MRLILSIIAFLCATVAAIADPITITDSRGPQTFETTPTRVVVSNWGMAEILLDLGVVPVGSPDLGGYAEWVVAPAIPEGVKDIGLRGEPNLETIVSLQPDLIILADEDIALAGQAAQIAPVVHFNAYSEDHDNVAVARENFMTIARLFDKEAEGQARLDAMDARLLDLGEQIAAKFDGTPPAVTIVRFIDGKRVVVYGENGTPAAALAAMGLTSAVDVPNSRWGLAFQAIDKLGEIEEGVVLHIEPFAEAENVFGTALWNAMPFVRNDAFGTLPALWTYGGPVSVERIGEAIADALLQ